MTAITRGPAAKVALDEGALEAMLFDALRAATLELFANYGVVLTPIDQAANFPAQAYLGAVGLSASGINGSLILGAGTGALKQSKPIASTDRDWTRELSNQLFGRVKMKLLRAGVEVWSTTPAVVDAKHVMPKLRSSRFNPLCFHTSDGELVLSWAEVEVTAKIQLDPPKDPEALPNEGDVILF